MIEVSKIDAYNILHFKKVIELKCWKVIPGLIHGLPSALLLPGVSLKHINIITSTTRSR